MKKLAVILLAFLQFQMLNAQDTCLQKTGEDLKKAIRRNLFAPMHSSLHKSEFIIFDIKLKKNGQIDTVEVYKKDPTTFQYNIDYSVSQIKRMWKPVSCTHLNRMLIPIWVFFDDTQNSMEQPFQILSDLKNGLYVVPLGVVGIPSRKQKIINFE